MEPYKPTDFELAFAQHIWAPHNDRCFADMLKDALGDGGYLNPYNHFYGEEQWYCAMQVLDHCTNGSLGYQDSPIGLSDNCWTNTSENVRKRFYGEHQKAKDDLLARYKAATDPVKFAQDHPSVVIRDAPGIAGLLFDAVEVVEVKDPWGIGIAEWFLEHMTKFMIFVFWYKCRQIAMEQVEINLTEWMCGGQYTTDAPKAVKETFQQLLKRLDSFITLESNPE